MAIVEGIVLLNGLVEISFGLLSLIDPNNILCQLQLPFSTDSHAAHLWSGAIIAIGIGCIYAFLTATKTQDQRFLIVPLVTMIFYHITLLYSYYLAMTGNMYIDETYDGGLFDPSLNQIITIPLFLQPITSRFIPSAIELGPLDFMITGIGIHLSMLLFTLIAFCLCNIDGPLTNAQYQYFLKVYTHQQRQLDHQQQQVMKQQQQQHQQPQKSIQKANYEENDLSEDEQNDTNVKKTLKSKSKKTD